MGMLVGMSISLFAQENDFDPLAKGTWTIGTTIAPLGGGLHYPGFSYTGGGGVRNRRIRSMTLFSIGSEVGYFVQKNLELKAGLGYTFGTELKESLTYMVGAKYYFKGKIPVQVDFSGRLNEDRFGRDVNYFGIQAGYAFFLGKKKKFSIEPSLKYNIATSRTIPSFLQFNTSFYYRF